MRKDKNREFNEIIDNKKKCKSCKEIKPLDNFGFYAGYYRLDCKICLNKISRERPSRKQTMKNYIEKNKEKLKAYKKSYREKKVKENPNYSMESYYRYRDKILYNEKEKRKLGINHEEKAWYNARYHRKKHDAQYKLAQNLRHRIYMALKENLKSDKTTRLLGCTVLEFKQYLESKFLPGMDWDNYTITGWHIDHIKPCDSFDLSKSEEQQKCFHYTNMQPLWATKEIAEKYGCFDCITNLEKSNKIL